MKDIPPVRITEDGKITIDGLPAEGYLLDKNNPIILDKRISELERRVDFIYEQLEEILKKFD